MRRLVRNAENPQLRKRLAKHGRVRSLCRWPSWWSELAAVALPLVAAVVAVGAPPQRGVDAVRRLVLLA